MRGAIVSMGTYLPLLRLRRRAAVSALRWAGLGGTGKGLRAVAGWDEDALTLAVEAARLATWAGTPERLIFASTSGYFYDRAQSVLLGEALGLPRSTHTQDVGGSRRCAVAALRQALEHGDDALIAAGEKRPTSPGGAAHLSFGDGGAAVRTGSVGPARLLGSAGMSADLLDLYASRDHPEPYLAEERFVRDVAARDILAPTIREACAAAGVEPAAITLAMVAEPVSGTYAAAARTLGMNAANLCAEVTEQAGDLGAAHPLFALGLALDRAVAGDLILIAGFGSGCDALVIAAEGPVPGSDSAKQSLEAGVATDDYLRVLSLTGGVVIDWGVRAEFEQKTQASVLARSGRDMHGFIGGRDMVGNVQFPKSAVPVRPGASGPEDLSDVRLADEVGTLVSITADRLNYTPDPPFWFGLVQFDNGARLPMELTDAAASGFSVGEALQMRFRIKSIDRRRGMRTYFWKAAPARRPALEG